MQQARYPFLAQYIPCPGDEILVQIRLHSGQRGIEGAVVQERRHTSRIAEISGVIQTAIRIFEKMAPIPIIGSAQSLLDAQDGVVLGQ